MMWALISGCATPWLSLFLAAQVLSSCFFVAHSQATKDVNISIVRVPEYPTVGESVTLIPERTARDVTSCLWLRSLASVYLRIFLYEIKPVNMPITKGEGYDGRQVLKKDCSLHIKDLYIEDMALYKIIKNTTRGTETGETFLQILQDTKVVTISPLPHDLEPKVITVGSIVGIIIGCMIGSLLIIGVVTYQMTKKPERPGSQQSIHNLGPIPGPE